MKSNVEAALARAAEMRRSVLTSLSPEQRLQLLEDLFIDFFVTQWQTLVKWGALTGQSAQVDTGYIAQHIASIVLTEPGQGFRGKGYDLMDMTEVKSAAILSGVDRPRWNHNLGTPEDDKKRQAKATADAAKPTTKTAADAAKRQAKATGPLWQQYLALPHIFYLLFDRIVEEDSVVPVGKKGNTAPVLRVRAWCVNAQEDKAWRSLVEKFVKCRAAAQYNFQLHPPVGYNDSIVVNSLGNLDMAKILVFDARIHGLTSPNKEVSVKWVQEPPPNVRPVTGQCCPLTYGKRGERPSRLNAASEMLPDPSVLQALLPGIDVGAILKALNTELAVTSEDSADEEIR